MYYKIEPTGVCERKGYVQIRYSFFLEPEDHNYEKHYVEVPNIPEDFNYERDDEEILADVEKLPKKKQLNPFHNHFYYFEDNVTDEAIDKTGKSLLKEFYKQWKEDRKLNLKNRPLKNKTVDNELKEKCELKVNYIKNKWQQ